MTKILDPKECLRRFIEGKIQHNRDLHEAGLNNLYFEWESFGNDILNQADLLESYVQQCGELRSANDSLKRDIERLNHYKEDFDKMKQQYYELQEEYGKLQKEYDYLVNGEPADDMNDWEF